MAQVFLDREGLLIVLVAAVALALLAVAGFFLWNPPDQPVVSERPDRAQETPAVVPAPVDPPFRSDSTLEFRYPGEDGRTVLELLKRDHEVRLDSELLLFGSIVLQIDSFAAAPNQYWIYYRDSLRGDRSPEVCTTSNGETIRWVLTRRR